MPSDCPAVHTALSRRPCFLQRARVLRARGHLSAANDVLDQAESAAREQGTPRLDRLAQAERAWIALLDGRGAEAERWADALDRSGLDSYAREPELLVFVRIRRAQGAAADLTPLLEGLLAAAEEVGRGDSVIGILVQLGLLREQVGDGGALDALARAVSLAEPAGYLQVFVDEGEPLLALLRRLLRRGGAPPYTARVLRAFTVSSERLLRRRPTCSLPGARGPASADAGPAEPCHRRAAGDERGHDKVPRTPSDRQTGRGESY